MDGETGAGAEQRCAVCGYGSADRAFFRLEPDGLPWRKRRFCAGCGPYRATAREWRSMAVPPLLTVIGASLAAAGGTMAGPGHFFLFLGIICAALIPALVVHELGHAALARLLGMRVLWIGVGSGPLLASGRIGGTRIEARRYLLAGGRTLCYDLASAPRKWRWGLVLLGGAGANLIAFAAGILAFSQLPVEYDVPDPVFAILPEAILVAQLVVAAVALVPRTARLGQQQVTSDGMQVIRLVRSRDYRERALDLQLFWAGMGLLESGRCEEARLRFDGAWTSRPRGLLVLAGYIEATGKALGPRAALQCYRDHRPAAPPTAGEDRLAMASVLATAAWYAAQGDDDPPLAERLSQQALDAAPGQAEFQAVRGAVLACRDPDQGRPLLLQGIRGTAQRTGKAELVRFLARVDRAPGELALADQWDGLAAHLAEGRAGSHRRPGGDASAPDARPAPSP